VLALAGRRIDPPDAGIPRFPLASVPVVRRRIRDLLVEREVGALVCSAACGADLLALEAAEELGLRARIVLPFDRDGFRESSVTDRPGDWGAAYDRLVAAAERRDDLRVLGLPGGGVGDYARTNGAILEEAVRLAGAAPEAAGGSVLAAVVWEGTPRPGDDLTADFARRARDRGIPVVAVPTL
jgi:hypothetical protein